MRHCHYTGCREQKTIGVIIRENFYCSEYCEANEKRADMKSQLDSALRLLSELESRLKAYYAQEGLNPGKKPYAVYICKTCPEQVPSGKDYCCNACRQKAYRARKKAQRED